MRKFNSKGFKSDERKIENEKISCLVNRGKHTYASEMERKRRNLGTEYCLVVGDESLDKGEYTIYSIIFYKKRSQISNQINYPLTACFFAKVKSLPPYSKDLRTTQLVESPV